MPGFDLAGLLAPDNTAAKSGPEGYAPEDAFQISLRIETEAFG